MASCIFFPVCAACIVINYNALHRLSIGSHSSLPGIQHAFLLLQMNTISCMGKPWIGSNKDIVGIEPPKITATMEKARCVLDLCQCWCSRMILGLLYNASFKKRLADIKV